MKRKRKLLHFAGETKNGVKNRLVGSSILVDVRKIVDFVNRGGKRIVFNTCACRNI